MTIEFECKSCLSTLRVPDSAAGKNARCPACQTILPVPDATAQPFGEQIEPTIVQAPGDSRENPYGVSDNPFAGRQANSPYAIQEDSNPYKSNSTSTYRPNTRTQESTRQLILAAGIVMVVFDSIGVVLMAFGLIGTMLENDLASALMAGSCLIALTIGIMGGIAMIRGKGWGLAMAGTIATMASGLVCCCLPTAVGIFPLVALLNADAKLVMNQ